MNAAKDEVKNMENKKATVVATKRDTVFLFFTVVLSVLIMIFAAGGRFKLGFTISYVAFMIFANVYLMPPKSFRVFPVVCGLLAVALSFLFGLYPDGLIHLIAFFVIAVLSIIYFICICNAAQYYSGGYHCIGDILRVGLFTPIAEMHDPFVAYQQRKKGGKKTVSRVLWGVALALPVICVVVPLLVRSDAAFQGMINKACRIVSIENVIFGVIGIIVSPFLISFLFHLKKTVPCNKMGEIKRDGYKVGDSLIINVFLSVVCIAYIIYLVSQLAYFFNAFSGILPQGYDFTRAEYARRGFFEMTGISVINLLVLFLAQILIQYKSKGDRIYTKIVSLFVCFFTLFIIATALFKMLFYIECYGMTRLRIGTSAFMILLALIFIAVIIRLFIPKFPYMKMAILSLGLVVAIVGFADIDRCIASYNIWQYENAQSTDASVDVQALSELSDSVIPYLIRLMEGENPVVSQEAVTALQNRFNRYFTKDENGNFVKTKYANDGLRAYNKTLRENQSLLLKYAEKLYVADVVYTEEIAEFE